MCLNSDLPSIANIRIDHGNEFAEAYLCGWIINLQEFFNVGKNMNDVQIRETAYLICNEYHNLNLADINLIFKRAKLGKYGKLYDRLDGCIILDWFAQYYDARCEAAANNSMRNGEKTGLSTPDNKTRISKLIRSIFGDKNK